MCRGGCDDTGLFKFKMRDGLKLHTLCCGALRFSTNIKKKCRAL